MGKYEWWKNGRFQGEFEGDVSGTAFLQGDGFALVVPHNQLIRCLNGIRTIMDLSRPENHLTVSEIILLVDGFLKHPPGRRWTRGDLLEVLEYGSPGKHTRSTAARWLGHIRKVTQDGRLDGFFKTDRYHTAVSSRYAWYLDGNYTYILIDEKLKP